VGVPGGGGGGLVSFCGGGALFSIYLSIAILPLVSWSRSDSVSHALFHAKLNGMERIGVSASAGWTLMS
jgi:hypothetical protein